jgi:hypothetical protein
LILPAVFAVKLLPTRDSCFSPLDDPDQGDGAHPGKTLIGINARGRGPPGRRTLIEEVRLLREQTTALLEAALAKLGDIEGTQIG